MSFYMGYKNDPTHTVLAGETLTEDDGGFTVANPEMKPYDQEKWWDTDMVPEKMRHNSGHGGSHVFITHEFISAILEERQPAIDIYEALAYTVPGIIAHDSALRGGVTLSIPQFDQKRKKSLSTFPPKYNQYIPYQLFYHLLHRGSPAPKKIAFVRILPGAR